jgi:hypothetical protein
MNGKGNSPLTNVGILTLSMNMTKSDYSKSISKILKKYVQN